MQIMYGIGGERRLTEWQVPWLPGYEGSAPVRIGNAAHNQRQLDIFGELMDALHQARRGGLGGYEAGWDLQRELLAHLETIWAEPDEGIWEVRSGREHFTYSKVMAWVAFDRAIKSAEAFDLHGPVAQWTELRDKIHADVCARGFDAAAGTLRARLWQQGARRQPAAAAGARLPAAGGSARARDRRGDRARLMADGLVLRYDTATAADGLPPGEGVFLACSSGWPTPI